MKVLRELINKLPLFEKWSRRRKIGRWRKRYEEWVSAGRELPMPHYGKQLVVADYGHRFNIPVLVETGTYTGHMVMSMLDRFDEVYSIELDKTLASQAKKTFSLYGHIHIIQGASEQRLPEILQQIHKPCLLWLDAHYSGGATAKGDNETPILYELDHVFRHRLSPQFVLLIDDARCFTGEGGYPTLEQLADKVKEVYPEWIFEVKDDIIRTHAPIISNSSPQ